MNAFKLTQYEPMTGSSRCFIQIPGMGMVWYNKFAPSVFPYYHMSYGQKFCFGWNEL